VQAVDERGGECFGLLDFLMVEGFGLALYAPPCHQRHDSEQGEGQQQGQACAEAPHAFFITIWH